MKPTSLILQAFIASMAIHSNIISIQCERESFFSDILKPLLLNQDPSMKSLLEFFDLLFSSDFFQHFYRPFKIDRRDDIDLDEDVNEAIEVNTQGPKEDHIEQVDNIQQDILSIDEVMDEDETIEYSLEEAHKQDDQESYNQYGVTIDIQRDEDLIYPQEIDELDDEDDIVPQKSSTVVWNWCKDPSTYFKDIKVEISPDVLVAGQDVTANLHGVLLKDLPSLTIDTRIRYNMFPPVRFVKDLCEDESVRCPVRSGAQTHKLTYHIPPLLSGRINIEAKLLTSTEEVACIVIGPLAITR